MISLTPIAREIQERMFEKMRALRGHKSSPNNSTSTDTLTFDNLATRSTFIRMVSNQESPITLMGGALKDNQELYSGYDIYSPRSYTVGKSTSENYEGSLEQNLKLFSAVPEVKGLDFETRKIAFRKLNQEIKTVNPNNRPAPGVKSIDVSFKGGVKALREAEISWVCWDFDELNLMMPHFLSTGKTVLLEWGWVYGADSLLNMNTLVDSIGNIKDDAFKDFSDLVIQGRGDFDIMVGVIKNFEFTTRQDGGFDCKTILTTVGHQLFDNPTPTSGVLDPGTQLRLKRKQNESEVVNLLKQATDGEGDDAKELLAVDTSVSLKLFISRIDDYIIKQFQPFRNEKYYVKFSGKDGGIAAAKKNQFLEFRTTYGSNINRNNYWVQLGWLEDNVFDKFLGLTNSKGERITSFRSIEKNENTGAYESVKVRNHPNLETTNLNNHILPGQFYPQSAGEIEIEDKKFKLNGDKTFLHDLDKFINSNFDSFNFNEDIETPNLSSVSSQGLYGGLQTLNTVNPLETGRRLALQGKQGEEELAPVKTSNNGIGKLGYLRHILINTKILKEAFGVQEGTELGIESINVKEAVETMFDLLNQDLDFWSFAVTTDEQVTSRAKIIDENRVGINLESLDSVNGFKAVKTRVDSNGKIIGNPGVFYFPTWRADSFVKSQNITGKITNATALSAMYGANMEVVKETNNPGNAFVDKSGVATGLLYNDELDRHKEGIDIGFRNELHGSIPKRLIDGKLQPVDQSVTEYLKKESQNNLEQKYEDKLNKLDEKIKQQREAKKNQEVAGLEYDTSLGLPPTQYLSTDAIKKIFQYESDNDDRGFFAKLFSDGTKLQDTFGSKFRYFGMMKQEFIDGIGFLITNGTKKIGAQNNLPIDVLLDLDLEIDGTGGILPGNSFNSEYLPVRYQNLAVYQTFEISHKVDSSGWSTSLSGVMRSSMAVLTESVPNEVKTLIDNLNKKIEKSKPLDVRVTTASPGESYELETGISGFTTTINTTAIDRTSTSNQFISETTTPARTGESVYVGDLFGDSNNTQYNDIQGLEGEEEDFD